MGSPTGARRTPPSPSLASFFSIMGAIATLYMSAGAVAGTVDGLRR
jgi:hypothetical protein